MSKALAQGVTLSKAKDFIKYNFHLCIRKGKDFIVYCDASYSVLGIVFMQDDKFIAYALR